MNFKNKNILIFGYGRSGQSAHKLLQNFSQNIYIYDKKFKIDILKNNKNLIKNNKNRCIFNEKIHFFNNFKEIKNKKINFCILSPGVDTNSKEVKYLKENKIKIVSELELGASFCKGKIFAITGTNGKTTTANLLYHIFKTAKKEAFLCGNVGIPICEIAKLTTDKSFIVCEVSSFQLETTKNFKPYASCFLNLAEDHFDRHKNLTNYGNIKNKINNNFKTKKIFNIEDENVTKFSKKYLNSLNFNAKNNFFIKNNSNLYKLLLKNNLIGHFNNQNLVSACVMSKLAKIDDCYIKKAIKTFKGLPHRLEVIFENKDLKIINDSKATNPHSTEAGLDAVGENTILLLGGSGKGLDFTPIFKKKFLHCIAFGEARNEIKKCSNQDITIKEKFKDAVTYALELAHKIIKENTNNIAQEIKISRNSKKENHKQPAAEENKLSTKTEKLTILLSPACASFDEFTSYEARGNAYKTIVLNQTKQFTCLNNLSK